MSKSDGVDEFQMTFSDQNSERWQDAVENLESKQATYLKVLGQMTRSSPPKVMEQLERASGELKLAHAELDALRKEIFGA